MTDPRPLAELPFAALGKRWVAWIAREVVDGCRDVLVYELRAGKRYEIPHYAFACVLGARLVPVGRLTRAPRDVAKALAKLVDGGEYAVRGGGDGRA